MGFKASSNPKTPCSCLKCSSVKLVVGELYEVTKIHERFLVGNAKPRQNLGKLGEKIWSRLTITLDEKLGIAPWKDICYFLKMAAPWAMELHSGLWKQQMCGPPRVQSHCRPSTGSAS